MSEEKDHMDGEIQENAIVTERYQGFCSEYCLGCDMQKWEEISNDECTLQIPVCSLYTIDLSAMSIRKCRNWSQKYF